MLEIIYLILLTILSVIIILLISYFIMKLVDYINGNNNKYVNIDVANVNTRLLI
jgi:hypothetical protein